MGIIIGIGVTVVFGIIGIWLAKRRRSWGDAPKIGGVYYVSPVGDAALSPGNYKLIGVDESSYTLERAGTPHQFTVPKGKVVLSAPHPR